MHPTSTAPTTPKTTVAALLVLTVATGIVDAASYLGLGHVFVANMTGNVVFFGFATSPASGLSTALAAVAFVAFLLGAFGGGIAGRLLDGSRWWPGGLFVVDGLVLVAAAAMALRGVDHRMLLVAMLALAFGVQNSTVRRMGVPDLTTTVLTLTVTGLAADSRLGGGPGGKPVRRLTSIAAMLAGAAIGAELVRVSLTATIAATAGAAVVAGMALLLRPGR